EEPADAGHDMDQAQAHCGSGIRCVHDREGDRCDSYNQADPLRDLANALVCPSNQEYHQAEEQDRDQRELKQVVEGDNIGWIRTDPAGCSSGASQEENDDVQV
ncbi:hypothetical protein BZG24_29745, partial [Escherichia coli]|nr:hypothetical protein [Escherichia coli]